MKYCVKCQLEYDDKFAFCHHCGSKLQEKIEQVFCPYCGNKIETDGEFCPFCGKLLIDSAPSTTASFSATVEKPKNKIQKKNTGTYTTDNNNNSLQIGDRTKSFLETVFLLLLTFFIVLFVIPKIFDLMRDYSIIFWLFIAIPVIFTIWFIYQSIVSVGHGLKKKEYKETLLPILILVWVAFVIGINVFK